LPAHVEFFNLQNQTSIKHTLLHAIEVMSSNTLRLNEYQLKTKKFMRERKTYRGERKFEEAVVLRRSGGEGKNIAPST